MLKNRGVTLMEVMITVAIIGILSAIAVPSYNSYVTESRRNEAKNALLELGQFMERHYTANSSYGNVSAGVTTSLDESDLPFDAVPKDGGTAYYNVTVSSNAATYTLTLTPTGVMSTDACGNYTLNQTGAHTPSAGNATCW
jgi:type IV pilus assembly protein PilE